MSIARLDAVIVGGGIGGLATALLLARAGASVTLLERAAEPAGSGAGILLHPNGSAVLAGLGLGAALEREGHPMTTATVRGSGGAPVFELAVPDFGPGLGHVLAVRCALLHSILLAAAGAEPVIDCRLGATVKNATAGGTVDLDWRGRTSSIEADLVVGADGGRSTVRRAGSFGAREHERRHRYVRGLVARHHDDVEGAEWTALGLFGCAAVDARTCCFHASATAAPITTARDLPAFQDAWARASPAAGRVVGRVSRFEDLLVTTTGRVDCDRWHDGRLVLLGDAAHAMAPTLGQGANSALVDAVVLTAELAATTSVPDALERYARRRKRAVTRVQDRADRIAWLSALTSPGGRRLRDIALRATGRVPGVTGRLVHAAQQEEPAGLQALTAELTRQHPG
jgi:2-polyprenyl-6-methoxyphenol hydroxylase-like FAD-dependent oxidoreductase